MAINRQALLRDAQTYSAPTRRALGTGLQDALLSTRYTDNPNVAALVTRQALRGYGEGLSSAVSSGQKTAADIDIGYQGLDLKKEQLAMEKEHYDDLSDAYGISGAVELGLLANDLTGGALGKTIGSGVTALGSALGLGGGGSTVAGTTAAVGGGAAAVGGGALALGSGGGVGATATTAGGAAFEAFSGTGAATTGATAAGTGLATTLGVGAAILAAPVLGPTVTKYGKQLMESLGMGGQTAPSGVDWLNALAGGNTGTVGGYSSAGSWGEWLNNYRAGKSTMDPQYQLSAMTGLTPEQALEFGTTYKIPGFEQYPGFGTGTPKSIDYYRGVASQNLQNAMMVTGG